jgi:hypothetical protein
MKELVQEFTYSLFVLKNAVSSNKALDGQTDLKESLDQLHCPILEPELIEKLNF